MATVLYVPKDTRWDDFGNSVVKTMEILDKAKDEQLMAQTLKGINDAPDRNSALQVVAASANGMKDPKKLATVFGAVDARHPASGDDLQKMDVYDSTTGNPSSVWFPRKDSAKALDPNYISERSGLPVGSFSTAAPKNVFEFVSTDGMSQGNYVAGMQPKGLITKNDFERNRELSKDELAQKAADISEKRLILSEKSATLAERRASESERHNQAMELSSAAREKRLASGDSSDKESKRISLEQTRLQRYLAQKYGGKVLMDGSLDLSSLDEPKKQKFIADFDAGSAMLEDGKAKTFGAAVRTLNKNPPELNKPDSRTIPQHDSGQNPMYLKYKDSYNAVVKNEKDKTKRAQILKELNDKAREMGLIK